MGYRFRHPAKYGKIDSGSSPRARCGVLRDDQGVTAVEFALLAPMLIFAVLATVDLGLAISERMTIGHILRAGAQGAAEDIGVPAVDRVLRTTAAKNMTVATAGATGSDTSLALEVSLFYSCAEGPSEPVDRSANCAGNAPTQIFYILSGRKTYSGLILPEFSQSRELRVQVR